MFNLPNISFEYPTYIVGGWCRDKIIDPTCNPKDLDLCMVAPSFEAMENALVAIGAKIFLSKPEYLTIRCKIPNIGDVDIALARTDGEYIDGDITINAIAIDISNGDIVDPYNGRKDIERGIIRCVRNPKERFEEDYLRLLRTIRFAVTKGFEIDLATSFWLTQYKICEGIKKVSQERIREELYKCFKYNTIETLKLLEYYFHLRDILFENNIWLEPTLSSK